MNILRVPLFIAAFITALFLGYKMGKSFDPLDEIFSNQSEEMVMPDVQIPNNHQFNFLIIGVDELDRPDTQLESIWLVAHTTNSSKITLVPVFPSTDDHNWNIIISNKFSNDGGKPGKEFWDVMKKTNIWWKGYIVSDIATTVDLVDILGGISIHGQQMNGKEALNSMTSWRDDASTAINHQKLFLESICKQIADNPTVNIEGKLELLDHNLHSNPQTKSFISGWITNSKMNDELRCTFPTLSQTSLQLTINNP